MEDKIMEKSGPHVRQSGPTKQQDRTNPAQLHDTEAAEVPQTKEVALEEIQ